MDRNTLWAVIFSFVFILGISYLLRPQVDPNKKVPTASEEKQDQKSDQESTPEDFSDSFSKDSVRDENTELQKNSDTESDTSRESADLALSSQNTEEKQNKQSNGSEKFYRIIPIQDLDARTSNKRAEEFRVQTDWFDVEFSTLRAGIKSLQLKKYSDNKGNLVDSVFDSKDIYPLSTHFVRSKKLSESLPVLYDYALFHYSNQNLKLSDPGNIGEKRARSYQDWIQKNIKERQLRYPEEKEENPELHIVVFVGRFHVGTSELDRKEIELMKLVTFQNSSYLIDMDFIWINRSDEEVFLVSNDESNNNEDASFYIHWGRGLGPFYDIRDESVYDQGITKAYLKVDSQGEVEEEEIEGEVYGLTHFKWLAIDSRYLALYMIGDWSLNERNTKIWNKNSYFGEMNSGPSKEVSSWFGLSNSIAPEKLNQEILGMGFRRLSLKGLESRSLHMSVFIGPKTRFLLNEYEEFDLQQVRDRGWFIIVKPLEWAMEWFVFSMYRFIPNFGWVIVFLAFILKVLFHPLTKKTLVASKRMQALSPKLKELEKKYKNDAQQKQKAMMELYKKEKVNPLGGCLPMLLQLPVFYALWNVLPFLLELKNANFLWIQDLSSPDTVLRMNLIFTDKLNILPIVMTATSIVQMKLMPQSPVSDERAKMMKNLQYFMPGLFLFIFWNMPSGLVLYWTVQNLLQILQQMYTDWKASKNNGISKNIEKSISYSKDSKTNQKSTNRKNRTKKEL